MPYRSDARASDAPLDLFVPRHAKWAVWAPLVLAAVVGLGRLAYGYRSFSLVCSRASGSARCDLVQRRHFSANGWTGVPADNLEVGDGQCTGESHAGCVQVWLPTVISYESEYVWGGEAAADRFGHEFDAWNAGTSASLSITVVEASAKKYALLAALMVLAGTGASVLLRRRGTRLELDGPAGVLSVR